MSLEGMPLPPEHSTVLGLLKSLKDERPGMVLCALKELEKFKPALLAPHAQLLVEVLENRESDIVHCALQLLSKVASSASFIPLSRPQRRALLACRHPRLGSAAAPSMQAMPNELWRQIFAAEFDVAPIMKTLTKLLQSPVPRIGAKERPGDVYEHHEWYSTNTAVMRNLDLKKQLRQALKAIRQVSRA